MNRLLLLIAATGLISAAILVILARQQQASTMELPPGWYSTYLAGSKGELARDVAVDGNGYIYVTGGTASPDFPTTSGAYSTSFKSGGTQLGTGGEMDVFVSKFSPDGGLVCSTYLGGPNYDRAYAIEVDSKGFIYVAGRAGQGFPTTPGVIQPEFAGDNAPNRLYGPQDGFVAKLSGDCKQLIWSTYLGDAGPGIVRDIALDDAGNVYAAGWATGSFAHITPKAFQTERRGQDAVIVKISSDGARVLYGTYLGGSGEDGIVPSIRVDKAGSAYVVMGTDSKDAPVTPNAFQKQYGGGKSDYLVTKLSPDGSSLIFSTYAGGSGSEGGETHYLAIDASGNAYVTSGTTSADFPTTAGAFQRSYAGKVDAFVAKISSDGSRLLASTYLGGREWEHGEGIEVDDHGNVYVGSATESPDFPTTPNAIQTRLRGKADMWVAKLSPDLTTLHYSTLFGGSGGDWGRSLTIDAKGNVYSVGATDSSDFPTSRDAFQRGRKGYNVFLVRIPITDANAAPREQ